MPSIVQFLHSGVEHKPDNPPANNYKQWNVGDHKRKFLRCSGEYAVDDGLRMSELCFWNEWEPDSVVTELRQMGNPLLPKWLHVRDLLCPVPSNPHLQNTDPFIFDNEFKYFVCHQMMKKRDHHVRKPTALAKLDAGSLILFGSSVKANDERFFQLDTVFVVSNFIEYNPRSNPLTSSQVGQTYYDYVYSKLFLRFHPDVDLRLYHGATFSNKIAEMYSFVPSQTFFPDRNFGFARVMLGDSLYVNTAKTQGFKITSNLTLDRVRSFWGEIVHRSRCSHCLEGVRFY